MTLSPLALFYAIQQLSILRGLLLVIMERDGNLMVYLMLHLLYETILIGKARCY